MPNLAPRGGRLHGTDVLPIAQWAAPRSAKITFRTNKMTKKDSFGLPFLVIHCHNPCLSSLNRFDDVILCEFVQ